MNKMHNLQKWLPLPHSTVWPCAFNSCIAQLLLLLVFSILIFNVSLKFLYSKTASGRRFTNFFFFKLQVFVILCVCYSTMLLSWGVVRVKHTPLAAWLRSHTCWDVRPSDRLLLSSTSRWTRTADVSCSRVLSSLSPLHMLLLSMYQVLFTVLLWTHWCPWWLSCGQEKNSTCDSSQAEIQDSVSALWTEAVWAELAPGGRDEDGLGCCSVVWISVRLCCSWCVRGGSTVM